LLRRVARPYRLAVHAGSADASTSDTLDGDTHLDPGSRISIAAPPLSAFGSVNQRMHAVQRHSMATWSPGRSWLLVGERARTSCGRDGARHGRGRRQYHRAGRAEAPAAAVKPCPEMNGLRRSAARARDSYSVAGPTKAWIGLREGCNGEENQTRGRKIHQVHAPPAAEVGPPSARVNARVERERGAWWSPGPSTIESPGRTISEQGARWTAFLAAA